MITRDQLEAAMGGGHAFIHPSEIDPFCDYASRAHRLLEIGTGYGGCAVLMLLASAPHGIVHSIDPFVPDSHGTWRSSAALAHRHVLNASKVLKFDPTRWTLFETTSHEAAKRAKKARAKFDLVFVDGDHRYEAVRQDVDDWLPRLRAGGLLLLHDSRRLPNRPDHEFHRGWPGPTQAADELREDARVRLMDEVHSLTVWEKA